MLLGRFASTIVGLVVAVASVQLCFGFKMPRRMVKCADPGQVAHSNRFTKETGSSTGFEPRDWLAFQCQPGYQIVGDRVLFCLRTGRWHAELPQCLAEEVAAIAASTAMPTTVSDAPDDLVTYCQSPGPIENGRWTVESSSNSPIIAEEEEEFPEATSLLFNCIEGFTIVGTPTLQCENSGFWSSETPYCKKEPEYDIVYCDNPGLIANGQLSVLSSDRDSRPDTSDPKRFPETTRLGFICDEGYVNAASPTIRCERTGYWSEDVPACVAEPQPGDYMLYCYNPSHVQDEHWTFTVLSSLYERGEQEFPMTTRIQFTCDDGYVMEDPAWLRCDNQGKWTSGWPTCKDCGHSRTSNRSFSLTTSHPGDWPWTVVIANISDATPKMICGGVLLDKNTVLTAGSCLADSREVSDVRLYFGKFFINDKDDDAEVVTRKPSRIIPYPTWGPNDGNSMSDMVIVRFQQPVKFSDRIQPVCLPTKKTTKTNLETGRKGYLIGWGTATEDPPTEAQRAVVISIVPQTECIQEYRMTPERDDWFCAGLPIGLTAPCTPDIGGALVFRNPATDRYTVEGIVSFGSTGDCSTPQRNVVFTKIDLEWIDSSIKNTV